MSDLRSDNLNKLMCEMHAIGLNAAAHSERHITSITIDSRKVKPGALFIAVPGATHNGSAFIKQAVTGGAVAVLIDYYKGCEVDYAEVDYAVYALEQLSQKLGHLAAFFYTNPSQALKMTAVTGTNGKTTVAYALAQAFMALDNKSAYLGTIGNGIMPSLNESTMTTQDAVSLQKWLADFKAQQVEHVTLEVSSHALSQYRVHGCEFDALVFTNLSQDHLDYHGSMQAYADAKKSLFVDFDAAFAVINVDDEFARENLKNNRAQKTIFYGQHQIADLQLQEYGFMDGMTRLKLRWQGQSYTLKTQLIGRFNVENMLAVIAVLLGYGYDMTQITAVIPALQAPAGRMQWFKVKGKPLVVVDYAHTPDALAQVLMTLREVCKGALFVCFGCGGDRDRSKRAIMGSVAEQFADNIWITDDNPRSEPARQIVADIVAGMKTQASIEHDRRKAINAAINAANSDDVVLIAGKGHENYQLVGDKTLLFDDSAEVKRALGVAV